MTNFTNPKLRTQTDFHEETWRPTAKLQLLFYSIGQLFKSYSRISANRLGSAKCTLTSSLHIPQKAVLVKQQTKDLKLWLKPTKGQNQSNRPPRVHFIL